MNKEKAEEIAVNALSWMAGSDELISGFLGMTGASPDDLAHEAQNPDFLAFVLDYLLQSDVWVTNCAGDIGVKPQAIMQARQYLPGGDVPEWT